MKNINKKLKILIKQNIRITTEFSSSLVKIIKHCSQEKKLCFKFQLWFRLAKFISKKLKL